MDIGKLYRQLIVKDTFISYLVCRNNVDYNRKIAQVNELLRGLCLWESFVYIDINSIVVAHLADGLHFIETSKLYMAKILLEC